MIKKSSIYSPYVFVIPPSVVDLDKYKKWYSFDYLMSLEESAYFSTKGGNLISFTETILGQGATKAVLKIVDRDGDFYRNYLENEYSDAVVRLLEETITGGTPATFPGTERALYIAYGFDDDPTSISLKRYLISSVFTYKDSQNISITEIEFFIEFKEVNEGSNSRSNLVTGAFLDEDKTKNNFEMTSKEAVFGTQLGIPHGPRDGGVGYMWLRSLNMKNEIEALFQDIVKKSLGVTFDEEGFPYDSTLVKVDIDQKVIDNLTSDPASTDSYLGDPLRARLAEYGIFTKPKRNDISIYLSFNPNWLSGEENIRMSVVKSIKKMYTDAGISTNVDSVFINELRDVAAYHSENNTQSNERVIMYISDENKINKVREGIEKSNRELTSSYAIQNNATQDVIESVASGIPLLVINGPNSNVISLAQKKNAVEYVKFTSNGLLKSTLLFKGISNWIENNKPGSPSDEDRQKTKEAFKAAFSADDEFKRIKDILKANITGFTDTSQDRLIPLGLEAIDKMFDNYEKNGDFIIDSTGFAAYVAMMNEVKNYSVKYCVAKTVPMTKYMNSLAGLRPVLIISREYFLSDGYQRDAIFDSPGDTYLSGLWKIKSIKTHISSMDCHTEFDLFQGPNHENTITT